MTIREARTACIVLLALAWAGVAPAQFVLVKDLNTSLGNSGSSPGHAARIGDVVYFVADDGSSGAELWRTDGTEGGTHPLRDIRPGPAGSGPAFFVNLNGTLFFSADDGLHGRELWRSDGTASGTVMVKDVLPGPEGSAPTALAAVGEAVFFTAAEGVSGRELWKSDGTAAGTELVLDIVPGAASSKPELLIEVGGTLFFRADDGSHGIELWKSDGTASGTVLVRDIRAGAASSIAGTMAALNGRLFFSADDGLKGREIWASDGTPDGTAIVKDVNPGGASSSPDYLTRVGDALYFAANDGSHGTELWTSDGTGPGTVMVLDLRAGTGSSFPATLVEADGAVYFSYFPGSGSRNLARTDGTPAGTLTWEVGAPGDLTYSDGTLFFSADDGTHGRELWSVDGVQATLVADVWPGAGSGFVPGGMPDAAVPSHIVVLEGTVLFGGNDGVRGAELWRSDGTAGGTGILKDVNTGNGSSSPAELTEFGAGGFFTAATSPPPFAHSRSLWTSDGSTAGTLGVGGAFVAGPTRSDGLLFLSLREGVNGQELWAATSTGHLFLAKDVNPGSNGSFPANLTDMDGTLYFTAEHLFYGVELWKRDAAGTVLVKDINAFAGSVPSSLTRVGGTLFFAADDGVHGRELWTTDGTEEGTVLVRDILPGAGGSRPAHLADAGGVLYFAADDGADGAELWRSDGTEEGTFPVADVHPGSPGSFPSGLITVGGTLFFAATGADGGRELWRSDGTPSGTVLVKDVAAGLADSGPADFAVMDGTLLFSAFDPDHGRELWRSDGTPEGTTLVRDVEPGPEGSYPALLTALGGEAFFAATDAEHGRELWKTDGTGPGTVLVQDIAPGPAGSGVSSLAAVGGKLFFAANDGATGIELWGPPQETYTLSVSKDGTGGGVVTSSPAGIDCGTTCAASFGNGTVVTLDATPDAGSTFAGWSGACAGTGPCLVTMDRDGSAAATFTQDAVVPSLSIADASVDEPRAGLVSASLLVTLDPPATDAVTVDYATVGGTATPGSDYVHVSGTLTFAAGTTTRTIAVPVRGDALIEGDEACAVVLTAASGAALGDDTGVLTIVDDDSAGTFSFGAARYTAREAAPSVTITVKRTGGTGGPATVGFATSDGTAKAPGDYVDVSGTLTFNANVSSRTFVVPITRDAVHEPAEALLLRLRDPGVTGSIGTLGTAVLTIIDDDPAPVIALAAPALVANEGGGSAAIVVRRTGRLTDTSTVDYSTGEGTATEGTDYTSTSGTLSFGPGVASQTITVPVEGDAVPEAGETFVLDLSSPTGAVLGVRKTTTVTIKDDDQGVAFSRPDYAVSEATRRAVVMVTRRGGLTGTISVSYSAVGGTATDGVDYHSTAGTLTFGPGVATRTFGVEILNDGDADGTKTVDLQLSAVEPPSAVADPGTAVLSILDNEPVFQFTTAKYVVGEAAPRATIVVRRTGPPAGIATVDYAVADGTATQGQDYAAASGTLTFGPGQATRSFTVDILNDTVDEPNETVLLSLSRHTGSLPIGTPGTATLSLSDNDVAGRVQFDAAAYSAFEPTGTGAATVTLTRSGGTSSDASVLVTLGGGTAVAGVHYDDPGPILVSFGVKETSKTFPVTLIGDGGGNGSRYLRMTLDDTGGGLALGTLTTADLWIVDGGPTSRPAGPGILHQGRRQRVVDTLLGTRQPSCGQDRAEPAAAPATVPQ